MQCYDRTKTAVDSMQLARLTQRQNLGVIDPASAIAFFQKAFQFFGFSKDPDKERYDTLRQELWNTFAETVDTVDILEDQGRLTSDLLLRYIEIAEKVMADLKGLTDSLRPKIESSWLDPRFHDFYDFMKRVVTDWRTNLLPTLGPAGIFGQVTKSVSPGILIAGGLALLGLMRGRA